MKDWEPVEPEKDDYTVSYRRFLNADPSLMGAIGFDVFIEKDNLAKYGTLHISDCRKTIALEFGMKENNIESKVATRYKLDSIQEALNHLYEILEV